MTITFAELGFYIIGLFILFLTPGPVGVAVDGNVSGPCLALAGAAGNKLADDAAWAAG